MSTTLRTAAQIRNAVAQNQGTSPEAIDQTSEQLEGQAIHQLFGSELNDFNAAIEEMTTQLRSADPGLRRVMLDACPRPLRALVQQVLEDEGLEVAAANPTTTAISNALAKLAENSENTPEIVVREGKRYMRIPKDKRTFRPGATHKRVQKSTAYVASGGIRAAGCVGAVITGMVFGAGEAIQREGKPMVNKTLDAIDRMLPKGESNDDDEYTYVPVD